jgi:hypothetical protein
MPAHFTALAEDRLQESDTGRHRVAVGFIESISGLKSAKVSSSVRSRCIIAPTFCR